MKMSSCNGCIHYDVCQALEDKNGVQKAGALHCGFFDPRSKYIRKPCEIGAEIFGILEVCDNEGREENRIFRGNVRSISLDKDDVWIYIHYLSGLNCWEVASQLGKTIFLSEEDARKALTTQ